MCGYNKLGVFTFLSFPLYINLCRRSRLNLSEFPMLSVLDWSIWASEISKYRRATVSRVFGLNREASTATSLSDIRDGNCKIDK